MGKGRTSMRKIREVLRHRYENKLSTIKIAGICNIGKTTVQEYLLRFEAAWLKWPLPEKMTDEELEQKLYPTQKGLPKKKDEINFEYLAQELRKPNVTLALLWEEYKLENPKGYNYSYFCDQFRKYCKTLNYSMRQEHKAGEKGFVDFGEGLNLVDQKTGEIIPTKLFVFVWGASNYTFAKATLSEALEP
ncbi:MAG TPA: hypothetical protein DF296_07320 [Candidatus Margulisbacteria bacterium]|nr:MAG: hypothetical protein A2X43_09230 [Candidatus Margulisbacteria bacterium GWD2_39_127]HAR64059.1 hypothetical protein [Candidatus Margulisiibacteriota bacterium]HCT84996.1 hypothetical protein [Candidatus Margulisiibacteriota bacterium]